MNASPGVLLLAGPPESWNPYNCRFLCLSVSSDLENYVQRYRFPWRLKAKNVVPFHLQRRVLFSCSWSDEVLLLNKEFEVQKRGEYSSRDNFWTVDCQCSKPCASSDKLKDLNSLLYRTEVWVFSVVSFYILYCGHISILNVWCNFRYGLYCVKNEVFMCFLCIRKCFRWYLVRVFKRRS